ncbi:MAG TPA: hypothetical protein VGG64_13925 [Pirellulales bacterium]
MKRLLLAVSLAALIGSSSGCCLFDRLFGHGGCAACCGKCGPYPGGGAPSYNSGCGPGGCGQGSCGPGGGCGPGDCSPGCARNAGSGPMDGSEFAGPPTGGVTYPYYTTRGPRDYLASNPRGIGP